MMDFINLIIPSLLSEVLIIIAILFSILLPINRTIFFASASLLSAFLSLILLDNNWHDCLMQLFPDIIKSYSNDHRIMNMLLIKTVVYFVASLIFIIFTCYKVKRKKDISLLLMFSILGYTLILSLNDLISFYLSVELASISSYILAASNRDDLKSSEAGIKYYIIGAVMSAIMLFGLSLIYSFGQYHSIDVLFTDISSLNIGAQLGVLFVIITLFFKLAIFPFHSWAPDVYEGSSNIVTLFFTTIPKLVYVVFFLGFVHASLGNNFLITIRAIGIISVFISAVMALKQTDCKRLLAYSSIGHMGLVICAMFASDGNIGVDENYNIIVNYIVIYIITNLGLFAAIIRYKIDDLRNLAGFAKKYPYGAAMLSIFLLSIAGIPPFAGFFVKYELFKIMLLHNQGIMALLLLVASIISIFYYLKIIAYIYFEPLDEKNIIIQNNTELYTIGRYTLISLMFYVGLFLTGYIFISNFFNL